jgi:hypothetical protein
VREEDVSKSCSFCSLGVGQTWSDRLRDARITSLSLNLPVAERDRIIEKILKQHVIRLLMPGPGDLRICNVCVDLYAEAVRRELAVLDK